MRSVSSLPKDAEFRPADGFPQFVASADGRVLARNRGGKWRRVRGWGPSRLVHVYQPRVTMTTVGVLVASAWVGPRPDGAFVGYRDGDPKNLTAANLYWQMHRFGPPR